MVWLSESAEWLACGLVTHLEDRYREPCLHVLTVTGEAERWDFAEWKTLTPCISLKPLWSALKNQFVSWGSSQNLILFCYTCLYFQEDRWGRVSDCLCDCVC